MNRLSRCIKFQSKSALKSTLWFLGIYFAIYLAVFSLIMSVVVHSDGSTGGMNSGFFIAGAIFTFVFIAASHKSTFNYLLMFGNTRRNIYLSSVIVSTVLSIIMGAISITAQLFEAAVFNGILGNGTGYIHLLGTIYGRNVNIVTEFIWHAALFILIVSVALLYGALAYKFGKVFITFFWVAFGLCWTVLPIMVGINGMDALVNVLKAYFCIGVPGGILLASINFIITAAIINAAAYALSVRQSQVV